MRRSSLVLLCLLAGGLLALLVPAVSRSIRSAKTTSCANNLRQLWMMMQNYRVQYGARNRYPSELGERFWLKLSTPPTIMIDATLSDIYQCPVEGVDDPGCDFRGPRQDVNACGNPDVIGADEDGNHGEGAGGNILRKSGDTLTVPAGDELWRAADRLTCGGNGAHPPRRLDEKLLPWCLWLAGSMLVLLLVLRAVLALRGLPSPGVLFPIAVAGLVLTIAILFLLRQTY